MTIKWLLTSRSSNMLDKAFKKDKDNFKNPKALYLYFSSLVDLYGAE